MAQYLVTGAAGFIGSHLVDALLANGHRVRGLDNFSSGRAENVDPRCEMLRADAADPAAMRAAMEGAAGCFHLAAVASVARTNEDWLGTHRSNQTAAVNAFDSARGCGQVPVVYASSAAVYGDVGRRVAHEGLMPTPLTAYGADKMGCELHGGAAWRVHGVPTLGLRFFNVYGPRQASDSPYTGVISIFARALRERRPVTLHGDGRQVRDFVHVDDVVAHLISAMERSHARPDAAVVNVCTGRGVSLLELVECLGLVLGRAARVMHGPARAGDIRQSVGNPHAAQTLLGLAARVRLEDGLAALLGAKAAVAA